MPETRTISLDMVAMPVPLTGQARNVAASLAAQATLYQGTGASPADIAAGYRLAADRVADWAADGNWPRQRDAR